MTGTSTLIARTALGLAGATATSIAALSTRLRSGPRVRFDRWILGSLAATRLALFSIVFLALGIQPRGDIPAYYAPEALLALAGKTPYRDFVSSYAPLHSYLDAALMLLWRSPLAIILFALLIEIVLLWVWLHLGRALFPEERVRLAALLYVCSPVSLQYVTIDGHDNVFIALLIAGSLWLAWRSREAVSGALLGIAVSAVKFLPLIFCPAFVIGVKRPIRWSIGAAAVVLTVYGAFAARGIPILYPLRAEGSLKGSGNIPYLIESLTGRVIPPAASNAVVVLALLAVYALMFASSRRAGPETRLRTVALSTVALTLVLLLFAKKSWPPYLVFALFPMCCAIARPGWTRLRLALWCGFSLVAVVEHSFWASIMLQISSLELHARLLAHDPPAFVLFGLEALLIAGYTWLLVDSLRQIRAERASAGA